MSALLALIPNWLKFAAVGLLCAFLAAWGSYTLGKREGRQQAAVAQMEATIEAYQKREGIDDAVSDLNAYGLCLELGGVPDICRELRRLDEASGSE